MRRSFQVLLIVSTVNLMITGQFDLIACQATTTLVVKNKTQHDANTSFLNYSFLDDSYHDFVTFYQNQMAVPVAENEQIAFQQLYNPPSKTPTYANFHQLVASLTSTKMGTHTAAMNWAALYQAINLNQASLNAVEQEQLRFYNIIAAVYGAQFVNQLVQSITLANFTDGAVGDTVYYQTQAAQRMRFGTNFTDLNLLNQNYNSGQFAGTNINYVVEHEYGHAFSNYVKTGVSGRAEFNQTWVSNQSSVCLHYQAIVNNDNSQLLLDYLNQIGNQFAKNHNLTSYYYPSYKNNAALFPLILLPSNYSRVWFISNQPQLKDEYFAEAFAFWLSTPSNERGWNWGLINDFFMTVFPQYINQ